MIFYLLAGLGRMGCRSVAFLSSAASSPQAQFGIKGAQNALLSWR